jgi:membrane protease YdiL (CAAX protease family)
VLRVPVVRIVCALLMVGLAFLAAQLGLNGVRTVLSVTDSVLVNLIAFVLFVPITYGAYHLYIHRIELRAVSELSWRGAWQQSSLGLLVGLALFTTTIGSLWLLGVYQVTGMNHWQILIGALAAAVTSAFVQELIFRGVLYQIVEESIGTWWALGLSSLVFGVIHLTSPANTVLSTMGVLAAGVLFAGAFLLTRQLWLVIGIHAAWDFANDGIFGVAVSGTSGHAIPSLLQANLRGSSILTGGPFGVEASLVAVIIISIVSSILVWVAWRKHCFTAPFWQQAVQTVK